MIKDEHNLNPSRLQKRVSKKMAIVSPHFCAPYPVELGIVRKLMTITDGNFAVTDANGNLLFKVKEPLFSLSDKRVLLDASDTPILTLRENVRTQTFSFITFVCGRIFIYSAYHQLIVNSCRCRHR